MVRQPDQQQQVKLKWVQETISPSPASRYTQPCTRQAGGSPLVLEPFCELLVAHALGLAHLLQHGVDACPHTTSMIHSGQGPHHKVAWRAGHWQGTRQQALLPTARFTRPDQ